MTDVGILRTSGHEAFRGCLVFPVINAAGQIVQLYGRRVDGSGAGIWADGLPGGIFNEQAASDDVLVDAALLVVASIEDALSVLGAGHTKVIAPGRPRGFTRRDLAAIAKAHRNVTVLGSGHADLAARLGALGVTVRVAGVSAGIAGILGSATDPGDALGALLGDGRVDASGTSDVVTGATHEAESTVVSPSPRSVAPTAPDLGVIGPPALDVHEVDGDVFVTSPARSWRIRGAQSGDGNGAQMLRVALSVTEIRSDRFHLDTLDLYSARQRNAFLSAAVTELHTTIETLRPEMARVIAAAEVAHDREVETEDPLPEMTEAERTAATELLGQPDLMGRVTADLGSLGVVGEETNLLICYLATVSRLCERPFGVLVQSSSAAGKSTLAEAACSLVPTRTWSRSRRSPPKRSTTWTVAISPTRCSPSPRSRVRIGPPMRSSCWSVKGGSRSPRPARTIYRQAVDGQRSRSPVRFRLVMTTTAAEIDPELENRLVVLGVDENEMQTRAIQAAQRQAASLDGLVTKTTRNHLRQLHRNVQRLFAPFPVVIPAFEVEFPATATAASP